MGLASIERVSLILVAQHPSAFLQAYHNALVGRIDLEELRLRMRGDEVLEDHVQGFQGIHSGTRYVNVVQQAAMLESREVSGNLLGQRELARESRGAGLRGRGVGGLLRRLR